MCEESHKLSEHPSDTLSQGCGGRGGDVVGEIRLAWVNICRRTSTQKDGDHRLPSLYRITGGTISHVNVRGGSFGNEL